MLDYLVARQKGISLQIMRNPLRDVNAFLRKRISSSMNSMDFNLFWSLIWKTTWCRGTSFVISFFFWFLFWFLFLVSFLWKRFLCRSHLHQWHRRRWHVTLLPFASVEFKRNYLEKLKQGSFGFGSFPHNKAFYRCKFPLILSVILPSIFFMGPKSVCSMTFQGLLALLSNKKNSQLRLLCV